MSIQIRDAKLSDAPALARIYKPYVDNTAITFELSAPSADEFAKRITQTQESYPYLVLLDKGEPLGYAYAGPLNKRAAYAHSVELSIYLKMGHTRIGYGKLLYQELEQRLLAQDITNHYACITFAPNEAAKNFVPSGSISFHKKLGFFEVGHFHACGYKFEQLFDVLWLEKIHPLV